ncbi:uncharacterized protein LOC108161515 isoform X2 [Drosophila miranda]|uniref:uncharacterized protein LOC108161515 isoform X2 n=2 Tax=Drosophila miranda TaxID=7229 RepID=UPI0007E65A93|nr:uncharacterized protein LOC108161515 isoform X2 [Drosophila miranda]
MRALLMLSLIALSTSIDTRSCFSPRCTFEYSPVCAVDEKGVEHPFGNRCYFENANCRREEKHMPTLKISFMDCLPGKGL